RRGRAGAVPGEARRGGRGGDPHHPPSPADAVSRAGAEPRRPRLGRRGGERVSEAARSMGGETPAAQHGLRRVLAATLRRELLIALRRPGDVVNPLMFFVIAITLFPLGAGNDEEFLAAIAPGVVWVTALLAVMLSMDSLFRSDYEDGSLEQLLLVPQPLYFLLLAKVFAHWLVSSLPIVILAPVLGAMLALPGEGLGVLVLSLLLGTPTLNLIGAI